MNNAKMSMRELIQVFIDELKQQLDHHEKTVERIKTRILGLELDREALQ